MTLHDHTCLDDITFAVHRAGTASTQWRHVRNLYATIYAEPPYCEGAADVEDFASSWAGRLSQPSFRLVVAKHDDEPVGFAFGHQLGSRTRWWDGAREGIRAEVTVERPGRTFAMIELAVSRSHRCRGVGRELHAHVLAGLGEERVTLLVRPDVPAAQCAYRAWGYQCVGSIQPFPDAPVYDAMIKQIVGG